MKMDSIDNSVSPISFGRIHCTIFAHPFALLALFLFSPFLPSAWAQSAARYDNFFLKPLPAKSRPFLDSQRIASVMNVAEGKK
jgi:hypothetical protein